MTLPPAFRQTARADLAGLAPFLTRWLSRAEGSPGFSAADLEWKCWAPRGHWSDPCSYVLTGANGVAAHCGLVPAWRRRHDGSRLKSAHFIDWAADPGSLGAGVQVLRKVLALTDLMFAVGGTAAMRTILPLARFAPANEALFLARPVRPLRQLLTHQHRNWKLPIRFARNAWWARQPTPGEPKGWTWEPVEPKNVPTELWMAAHATPLARDRTPTAYTHYLACPFMRFRLFVLRHHQRPIGCVLIGFHLGQARLVDLWVVDESPQALAAAYQSAIVAALATASIAEVVVAVSTDERLQAARQCGFREYRREPIMVYPGGRVSEGPFDYQLLDDDLAFLTSETSEYVT